MVCIITLVHLHYIIQPGTFLQKKIFDISPCAGVRNDMWLSRQEDE